MKPILLSPLRFIALLALCALMGLSACSSDSDDAKEKDKDKDKAAKEIVDDSKLKPICPQVAILRDLQTVADYGREKPDPSQLVAIGKLEKIEGDCAYEDTDIDVKFTLTMAAQRGPRLGGRHVDFPYFIAIVDPQQNIVAKNTMSAGFDFSGDKTIKENSDDLHVVIPLPKNKRKDGPDYQVLIGFQLTPEQLDASRAPSFGQ